MAGGEFRLGTDSIYMADDGHIRPKGTSPKFWITWLRFQPKIRGCRVFSAAYAHRKKEARVRSLLNGTECCPPDGSNRRVSVRPRPPVRSWLVRTLSRPSPPRRTPRKRRRLRGARGE